MKLQTRVLFALGSVVGLVVVVSSSLSFAGEGVDPSGCEALAGAVGSAAGESSGPRVALVGATAATFSLLALHVWLERALGRPLAALTRWAREVERGVWSRRIAWSRRDELGQLVASWNATLDHFVDERDRAARRELERIHLLEELRRRDRERTVDYLASEIAHELGSPLNVVQGRAQMLAECCPPGSQAEELARQILEQTTRMENAIRTRVDRSQKHRPPGVRQPVGDVVRRAQQLLEPILSDRRITLSFDEEPGIVAHFDEERLLQVLTSLILTLTRTGQPQHRIELRLSRIVADDTAPSEVEPGRFALLRITDPNPDPDPTLSAQLSARDDGLGLSYRLCEDIVHGLGGFVEFESEAGRGTTFSVFLPKTVRSR